MPQANATQSAALATQQETLESAAVDAISAGLARVAQWRSLVESARQFNIDLHAVFGDQVAANEQATKEFLTLARAVVALEQGTGKLQRWQLAGGPVKWGVAKSSAQLGQWQPVAATVIRYAGKAAITYGAWYLLDLWGGAHKVESDANKLRAQNSATCQQTAQQLVAAGRAQEGALVAQKCAEADQAAAKPEPGLWEGIKASVVDVAKTAAAVGGGGLLIVGLLFMLSRGGLGGGGKKKSSYRLRSPLQLHRPVSFRRPWA